MSAAPSAHATVLDLFMTAPVLRYLDAGVHFDYIAAPQAIAYTRTLNGV
jgi:hypothetical protein